MQVLVIEDNEVDRRLIERALGQQFSLNCFSSLQSGLRALFEQTYDLIILDLNVDDSQGYETFKKAHAVAGQVPILVLSGTDDEDLALHAVANGAQDYICKNGLIDYPLERAARFAIERQQIERRRVAALHSYQILDTNAERSFDDLALLASYICQTPIALISLVDSDRQWFKAKVGIDATDSPRSASFCAHAIKGRSLFVVDDAQHDTRFANNPFVTGAPNIRFYAGAPLVTKAGEALGTICVIDHMPRVLKPDQAAALEALSRQVVDQLELRRAAAVNAKLFKKLKRASRRRIRQAKIAERLTNEQCGLREAVSGMEHVLGVVGHELRTPLAALRAISEFLVTDGAKNTVEADRFLNDISAEVDRMSDTVNNLLEAARLNSGRARWNWSEVDLAATIEEAMASIEPLIDSDKIVLKNRVNSEASHMAGDADAIRRLILNLLSNARKHTDKGSIEVSVSSCLDEAGQWAEIAVRDTGSGIAPEVAARLGEAFALNSGVVGHNHVSGAGLGLAICKGIAAAHGGNIYFESKQGEGTTVIVRLRVDLDAAATGDTVQEELIEEWLS